MTSLKPASLSGALLVAKGGASPALFRPVIANGGLSPGQATGTADSEDGPHRAMDPLPPGDSPPRRRISLRLDPARHLRLKLVAAHLRQSAQEILTAALDDYLDKAGAAAPVAKRCVCLAEGSERATAGPAET